MDQDPDIAAVARRLGLRRFAYVSFPFEEVTAGLRMVPAAASPEPPSGPAPVASPAPRLPVATAAPASAPAPEAPGPAPAAEPPAAASTVRPAAPASRLAGRPVVLSEPALLGEVRQAVARHRAALPSGRTGP